MAGRQGLTLASASGFHSGWRHRQSCGAFQLEAPGPAARPHQIAHRSRSSQGTPPCSSCRNLESCCGWCCHRGARAPQCCCGACCRHRGPRPPRCCCGGCARPSARRLHWQCSAQCLSACSWLLVPPCRSRLPVLQQAYHYPFKCLSGACSLVLIPAVWCSMM